MTAFSIHIPVLLHETVDLLDPKPGDVVVDGTVGGGGHSVEIAKRVHGDISLHCFDVDSEAIAAAEGKISTAGVANVRFYPFNFRTAPSVLESAGVSSVDRVLLDLGMRSDQLESSGRGFSFQNDEPLLMTLSDKPEDDALTAKRIVNTWKEADISNVLFGYGEERYAHRIAAAIVRARTVKPIETTFELVDVIKNAVPASYTHGRINPATKSFQALRIAVNDEYGALQEALLGLWKYVRVGGRLVVISFHSGEDGIVKRFMKERVKEKEGKLIVKKPIVATEEEIKNNPRSRSAKLRALEKIEK